VFWDEVQVVALLGKTGNMIPRSGLSASSVSKLRVWPPLRSSRGWTGSVMAGAVVAGGVVVVGGAVVAGGAVVVVVVVEVVVVLVLVLVLVVLDDEVVEPSSVWARAGRPRRATVVPTAAPATRT
jgi:hypothetical protein